MVSVIMPVYNGESTLRKSAESVLGQSYGDLELIIVDDGSKDASAKVGQELLKDKRVRFFHKENGGVSSARNMGLEEAKGEFVAFLDADDLWHEDFLKITMARMAEEDAPSFVYARTEEIFPDGKKALIGPSEVPEPAFLENFLHKTGELRLTFHISAILLKRSLIEAHRLRFEEGVKISEDTGFFLELLSLTEAKCVESVLTYYLRREESATTKKWCPRDWEGQPLIFRRIRPFVENHRPRAIVAFQKMGGYVAYRFVLKCLRQGYVKEAEDYIKEYQGELKEFAARGGKFTDRIKCKLLLSFGDSLWGLRLCGKL